MKSKKFPALFLFFYLLSSYHHLFGFADSVQTKIISDGVILTKYNFTQGPITLFVLSVDIMNNKLFFDVGITGDTIGSPRLQNSEISKRYNNNSFEVIASVNADFFGGKPMQFENNLVSNGSLKKGTNIFRSQLAFSSKNKPYIEKFRYSGKVIYKTDTLIIEKYNEKPGSNQLALFDDYFGYINQVSDTFKSNVQIELSGIENTKIGAVSKFVVCEKDSKKKNGLSKKNLILEIPEEIFLRISIKSGDTVQVLNQFIPNYPVYSLTGGYPGLIKDGVIPDTYLGIEGINSKSFIDKNPRTAIGFNFDSTKIYFVLVDGRQKNYSVGMSLKELAEFMKSLGIENAINLDGGGSSSLVIRGEMINKPSDKNGERPVCNNLMLIRKRNF